MLPRARSRTLLRAADTEMEPPPSLIVRRASVDDASAVARVHTRGWHVGYAHVFPSEALLAWQSDPERWRSRLDHAPRSATFVASRGDVVIGFSGCGPSRDEPTVGELYAIYVDPDAWGSGAGRLLLARAEDALAAEGFTEATLWVLDENPRARRFYERAGWHDDGARQHERFFETDVTEVRYRKRLGGAV